MVIKTMNDFLEIVKKIIGNDDILNNTQQTHAVLLDLALDHKRERLLARSFVEAGGYTLLKNAGKDYTIARERIIRQLREEFSLEANAAAWITHIFAIALGYEEDGSSFLYKAETTTEEKPLKGTPQAVAIGMSHTVALLKDGTVKAQGRNEFLQCDVDGWEQIRAVAAGDAHTIGLKANGCVVATGRNNHDQCDIAHLEDIGAVYAYGDDTICIGQNGTTIATGKSQLDLSHFEEIRSIAWHPEGVYGIREDGRVMMSSKGWEEEKWASELTDVVQIISTYVHGSFVLTAGGNVYKMGQPDNYFANLRDIVSMVDLTDGFAVLRKDGKVRILPYDRNEPRKASESDNWQDIAAIFGKYKRLIGLTEQGHLLAACTDPEWLKRNGTLDFLADWYPVGTAVGAAGGVHG